MKLFRKRKGQYEADSKPIPGWLTLGVAKVREKWVQLMQRYTSRLTKQGWVVVLGFIIVSGNGYGIYKVITGLGGNENTLSVGRISKPTDTAASQKRQPLAPPNPGKEYVRIMGFKKYMDSLARSPTGRSTYDSIIKQRPGIMDSLRFIEQYYSPTNK